MLLAKISKYSINHTIDSKHLAIVNIFGHLKKFTKGRFDCSKNLARVNIFVLLKSLLEPGLTVLETVIKNLTKTQKHVHCKKTQFCIVYRIFLPTHELVILTIFHGYRTKNVDFLHRTYF